VRIVLDIDHIREELNELPFKDGRREVFIGRISEMFAEDNEPATTHYLRQYEQKLRSHSLTLTLHENDRDSLFVVQELRAAPVDLSWMAEATHWVSKILAISLEMILPGLAGLWIDNQLETRFLGLLGFALGVPLGIWHIIAMTKSKRNELEW
jgi:hypothetical protein